MDGSSQIIFTINANDQVVSYEQIYAGSVQVLGKERELITKFDQFIFDEKLDKFEFLKEENFENVIIQINNQGNIVSEKENVFANLNKELEVLKNQREVQKSKRKKSNIPNVALVGYTNAGKSSVMNALVEKFINDEDKKVFEKNMLFATLETYVRNIKLDNNKSFLLSDTVGFVGDLPHSLVKAFRSTLEEVCDADLLLHVIDICNPNYENHINVTNETLNQIGADNIPVIYVYNKVDLMELDTFNIEGMLVSAKKYIGIEELLESICKNIFMDYIKCKVMVPYKDGKMTSYIIDSSTVLETEYTNEGTLFSIECSKEDYVKYQSYII